MIIVFRYFINGHLGCSITATTHSRFQVSIAVNKENLTSKLIITSLALAKQQVCSSEAGAVLKDPEGEEGLWKVQLSPSIDVNFEQLCVRCCSWALLPKPESGWTWQGSTHHFEVKALGTKHTDAQPWYFFLKNLHSLAAPRNSLTWQVLAGLGDALPKLLLHSQPTAPSRTEQLSFTCRSLMSTPTHTTFSSAISQGCIQWG